MNKIEFAEVEIKSQIKRSKLNKATGPDGIKNEIYKSLINSEICSNVLEKCFNLELQCKEKPDSWKTSTTILIPKKKKPTPSQYRPIALTYSSYKLFIGMIKTIIEHHLESNEILSELQSRFTAKRRLEDNLFILDECKEEAFRRRKVLVMIAIDFSKAYDSIDIGKIIEILTYYKVDGQIFDIVAEIYKNESTKIKLGEGSEIDFEITNGIRQGCNLSPTIFKMITYRIIEEVQYKCKGFNYDDLKINCILYADDGIIFEESIEETRNTVSYLTRESKKYGLEINTTKISVLIYNCKQNIEEINRIKVGTEMKYLGVKKEIRRHKKEIVDKAKRLEGVSYGVLERSCSRMMIGKVYWKTVALPSILHGSDVIDFIEKDVEKLQIIENNVYRKILRAPSFTPISVLRGEIGSSMM